MPIYYVYDVNSGTIVHRHENYDATSALTKECTREEVLSLVDPAHKEGNLEVLAVEATAAEGQELEHAVRVNVTTGELVTNE
jgi:hypothetical protein